VNCAVLFSVYLIGSKSSVYVLFLNNGGISEPSGIVAAKSLIDGFLEMNSLHSHPTGRLSLERKNGLVLS
jgi:hypothetical protein